MNEVENKLREHFPKSFSDYEGRKIHQSQSLNSFIFVTDDESDFILSNEELLKFLQFKYSLGGLSNVIFHIRRIEPVEMTDEEIKEFPLKRKLGYRMTELKIAIPNRQGFTE